MIGLKPPGCWSDHHGMRGLSAILRRLRRQPTTEPSRAPASVRHLEDALDRALEEGALEYADELASRARRHVSHSVRLAEQTARLRLAQGNAEAALAIIDGVSTPTASLRLLRNACLIQGERREEAHADLHAWCRRSSAPRDARLMLALLEWESGNDRIARDMLIGSLSRREDPAALSLLLCFASVERRRDDTERWSECLRRATRFSSDAVSANLLSTLLDVPITAIDAPPADADVQVLANELLAAETVIPALVAAEAASPESGRARLIQCAIELILDDVQNHAEATTALVRLSWQLDGPHVARRWLEIGLQRTPMSTALRQLEVELTPALSRPPTAPASPAPRRAAPPAEWPGERAA